MNKDVRNAQAQGMVGSRGGLVTRTNERQESDRQDQEQDTEL